MDVSVTITHGEGCQVTLDVTASYDSGRGQYAPGVCVEDVPGWCPECHQPFTVEDQARIEEQACVYVMDYRDYQRSGPEE